MNPQEILAKIQEFVSGGNLDQAKQFLEANKDQLGGYLEQAKGLVAGNSVVNNAVNAVQDFLK